MPISRRTFSLILILVTVFALWTPAHAQTPTERYFQETGHSVAGEFLAYYDSVEDPLLLFGYPITEAFQDPLSGITVQYFQRARFELHLEAAKDRRVEVTDLGALLYQPGPEMTYDTETPACRAFPTRGRSVCFAFLDFYLNNGGEEQFGLPVSNIEKHDDLYVQYFDKARLEWHPELPQGNRVTLANLGRAYFDQRGLDTALLAPKASNGITQEVIKIQARAFVSSVVLAPDGKQTLFVVVQDQYLRPVPQADVAVTVVYPDGKQESHKMPLTDQDGISQIEFTVNNVQVNQVVALAVEAMKGTLAGKAGAWFRIWW